MALQGPPPPPETERKRKRKLKRDLKLVTPPTPPPMPILSELKLPTLMPIDPQARGGQESERLLPSSVGTADRLGKGGRLRLSSDLAGSGSV